MLRLNAFNLKGLSFIYTPLERDPSHEEVFIYNHMIMISGCKILKPKFKSWYGYYLSN